MAKFRENIRATKASAAYGVNAFKDAQKTLLENGVLAKTREKVFKDGKVQLTKGNSEVVGTPSQIEAYV